ncbi:MAG: glycosyltransferase family 4 protein [Alphaproteobacteria bacterium]|nr:glycosyltransferase family 4 protein [Alphaproteobacteria bacterium]
MIGRFLSKVINIYAKLDVRSRGPYGHQTSVCYVVPEANWAADVVGSYVTQGVRDSKKLPARTVSRHQLATMRNQILHFGTIGDFAASSKSPCLSRNKVVATVFHGERDSDEPGLRRSIKLFLEGLPRIHTVVTGCGIMEHRLATWGVDKQRIIRIPLGVDLELFRPLAVPELRSALRKRLGIPEGAFCIGSFQKDGTGWEEGLEPKLIKGPDVFLDTLAQVRKDVPLFVLLSGPSRGYVKEGLKRLGIPFAHSLLADYREIAEYYHAIDAYLMTSREEGAPAALLEALASATPFIGTRVGMVSDIVVEGGNALIAASEDSHALARHIELVYSEPGQAFEMTRAGLETIRDFGWPSIARHYLEKVYLPLLRQTV